jgi:hypothetical protein
METALRLAKGMASENQSGVAAMLASYRAVQAPLLEAALTVESAATSAGPPALDRFRSERP